MENIEKLLTICITIAESKKNHKDFVLVYQNLLKSIDEKQIFTYIKHLYDNGKIKEMVYLMLSFGDTIKTLVDEKGCNLLFYCNTINIFKIFHDKFAIPISKNINGDNLLHILKSPVLIDYLLKNYDIDVNEYNNELELQTPFSFHYNLKQIHTAMLICRSPKFDPFKKFKCGETTKCALNVPNVQIKMVLFDREDIDFNLPINEFDGTIIFTEVNIMLLEKIIHKVNINHKNIKGNTVLHTTTYVEKISFILDKCQNIDINIENNNGNMFIHNYHTFDRLNVIVEVLKRHKFNLNYKWCDKEGNTLLHVIKNSLVILMLYKTYDLSELVNHLNDAGESCFHVQTDPVIIKMLLGYKPIIDDSVFDVHKNNQELIDIFNQYIVDGEYKWDMRNYYFECYDSDIIDIMYQHDFVGPEMVDQNGRTILYHYVTKELIDLFKKYKGDIFKKDNFGQNAIDYNRIHNPDYFKLLEVEDIKQQFVITYPPYYCNDYQTEVNTKSLFYRKSAADFIEQHDRIVKTGKININYQNPYFDRKTLFHYYNNFEIIKFLCDNYSDIDFNIKDNFGRTAYDYHFDESRNVHNDEREEHLMISRCIYDKMYYTEPTTSMFDDYYNVNNTKIDSDTGYEYTSNRSVYHSTQNPQLIRNMPNPNVVDDDQRTPLFTLTNMDCLIELIQKNDFDINKQDYMGDTGFYYHLELGHYEIVSLILENNNVDVTIRRPNSCLCLYYYDMNDNIYRKMIEKYKIHYDGTIKYVMEIQDCIKRLETFGQLNKINLIKTILLNEA